MIRIGFSRDIHRLENNNRPLILGGIHVPYEKGPVSHSDGDVLFHALAEALLGSLALGDLGTFYPDNEQRTFNMDSSIILKECYQKVLDAGYTLVNVDMNIICERPKLKPYIKVIRENIASILNCDVENISLKAQTNEKCGEVGREEAIEATCALLIERRK